ncbi:MAG TPA: PatB family C-S lyase [Bacteroidales bacterium]|nr:PatB family C-S lyase [Bacteroidales bacterium]
MRYNFDEPVNRQGTQSVKYDLRKDVFGTEDIIPMWVADMDFRIGDFIINALKERLKHEVLGYYFRSDEYFSSIINWLHERHSWKIERDWITFCPGIVPALNLCTLAFTEPGDKIIVQPPVYFPFFPAVESHNRILEYNKLRESNGIWHFDLDDLRKKAGNGARMIILCNPHNPVGRSWNEDELKELSEICTENGILIISDEIHSDLVLPGGMHYPVASLSDEIANNTVTCIAPSKTFNLAGLATSSLVTGNHEIRQKISSLVDRLHIGSGNIFGTEASIAAYSKGSEWLGQLLEYLKRNVEFVLNYFEEKRGRIKPVKPEATYMIWLDCREIGMNAPDLAKFFINAGVGMNEGSMFGPGGEGFMRMNIGCPYSTVVKAVEKIDRALKSL